MLKKIGFATCLASLAWLFGVLGLFIGEAVFNVSWAYTDALIKFPFGAIAGIVIVSGMLIKIYSLGKEAFYQDLVAIFLFTFLYFLVVKVLDIDLTENGLIAEIVVSSSLALFSWFAVLGFCKLCDTEEELRQAIVFWVIILSLVFTQILALLVGLGKITSEVFHPMVIEMLPVIWFSFIVMLYLLYSYLSRYYDEKYEEWYERERNRCGSF